MLDVKSWTVTGAKAASPEFNVPVALLAFNRPDVTHSVFECVRRRRPRRLLLVADGPRADFPSDAGRCDEVRRILTAIDWPCEVSTNFANANLGCGLRVSNGLDWVFEMVEEAIVLEDDCLPADGFFDFAAAMLERYRGDTRIGLISGTNGTAGHDIRSQDSYFFSRYTAVWGWATWRRSWQFYDFHMNRWEDAKAEGVIGRVFGHPQLTAFWHSTFERVEQGLIDTWDYQLSFASFTNSWLNIVPTQNLITNIGSGPAGTHLTPPALDRLPHGELRWPLRHPKFVVRNVIADRILERLGFEIDTAAP